MPEASTSTTKGTKSLPPGMVIGPDGKPCKICTAFRHWKPPTDSSKSKAQQNATATGSVFSTLAYGTAQSQAASVEDTRPAHCPPDVEQLGRSTWTFLHTTAAYYPEKPTPNQRANMLNLGLSRWFCERHNEVNERLGKDQFNCAIQKLDERWKDGPVDGSCD